MLYATLILAISCIFLVRTFAADNTEKKLWENYYRRTVNMKCKIPQKRALLLMQFKDKLVPTISDDSELEKLLPQFVIVKRCGDSGCCDKKGHECVAAKTKNETLHFFSTKSKKYFHLQVENHERCDCQKPNKQIK